MRKPLPFPKTAKQLKNGSNLPTAAYAVQSSTAPYSYAVSQKLMLFRDSGVNAIESLMERRGTFDYIILETSGLADPGNIAPMFWVDDGLGSSIYLDGIVTLVDARNILLSLDETPAANSEEDHEGPHTTTAHLQISHADVIIINKSDAVKSSHLDDVKERVQAINGMAKVHITQYAQVPKLEDFLLDLHAYDGLGSLDIVSKGVHSHLDPVKLPLSPLPTESLADAEERQSQHSHYPSPFFPLPNSHPWNHGSGPYSGNPSFNLTRPYGLSRTQ